MAEVVGDDRQASSLMRQGALTPTTVRTRHFGAVAALWQLAGDLDLVATTDRHCPQPGSHTPSVGTYLVLAAINLVVSPRSKTSHGCNLSSLSPYSVLQFASVRLPGPSRPEHMQRDVPRP
ncbi:MAG: hypothetical protein ACYDHB_04120, partial [Candidatus Dormibacteria bacterium]